MTEFSDFLYRRFCRQLRIACIVAWLQSFPSVRFETDDERDACVCMWLETPHDTVLLWLDSENVEGDVLFADEVR